MFVSFTCVLEVRWVLLWHDGDTVIPWEIAVTKVPFHWSFPPGYPSYPRRFVLGERYHAHTLPHASATVYLDDVDIFQTAYYDHEAELGESLS